MHIRFTPAGLAVEKYALAVLLWLPLLREQGNSANRADLAGNNHLKRFAPTAGRSSCAHHYRLAR